MAAITVSRELASPVPQVWSTLADFGGVHRFSPGVESSPINEGTPASGVGAERTCHLYDGNHIQERVIESVVNERLSIEVFDTSMPIKSADASITLEPTTSGGTRVTMAMEYVVKFGPLGVVMDALMMKRTMTTSLDRLLAGLERHVETGETIAKGWKPSPAVA